MRMRKPVYALLLLGLLVPAALAQNTTEPQGRRQKTRLKGEIERNQQMNRTMERLTSELQLSLDQQNQIRSILVAHQDKMKQRVRSPDALQKRQEAKDLRDQIETARQARDKQKLKELTAKARELRSQMGDGREELFTQVEAVLTPEQKTKFQGIRDELFGDNVVAAHPEILKQAVAGLELPSDKQQKIDGIMQEGKAKADATSDPKEKRRVAEEVYKRVMSELTPEQQQKVKQWRPERVGRSDTAPAEKALKRDKKEKGEGKQKSEGRKQKKQKAGESTDQAEQPQQ